MYRLATPNAATASLHQDTESGLQCGTCRWPVRLKSGRPAGVCLLPCCFPESRPSWVEHQVSVLGDRSLGRLRGVCAGGRGMDGRRRRRWRGGYRPWRGPGSRVPVARRYARKRHYAYPRKIVSLIRCMCMGEWESFTRTTMITMWYLNTMWYL